jgi:hypothetical protein
MGGRKSDKRYTNEAWTKRVDREAGSHRTRLAPAEPLVCEVCGDVYIDRRWTAPAAAKIRRKPTTLDYETREWAQVMENSGRKKHSHSQEPTVVFCPACQRQRDGEPSGFVHLEGAYLNERGEEIRHFLQKEAERAAENNPLARIMRWETDEKGRPTLATTTEHLAERLGRALDKAFKGEVRYDFSHENKLAHVYWRRD